MLVRFGNVICNWDLSKGQMGLFGAPGEKKEVQQPGKLGGIFYRTESGKVVYGQKPIPKARKKKIEPSNLLQLFGSQPEKIKEHQKDLQGKVEKETDPKKKVELIKQQAFTELAEQNKKKLKEKHKEAEAAKAENKQPWEMTREKLESLSFDQFFEVDQITAKRYADLYWRKRDGRITESETKELNSIESSLDDFHDIGKKHSDEMEKRQNIANEKIKKGRAYEVTKKQFREYHITGTIQDSAYDRTVKRDAINEFDTVEKYPILVKVLDIGNEKIELRQEDEYLRYVKTNQEGDMERDEHGKALYLTKQEIKDRGLREKSSNITAFNEKGEPIASVSDEWGADGVFVIEKYQKKGIGTQLLKEFRKQFEPSRQIGQATSMGVKMVDSLHREYVRQALTEGKKVPDEVLKDYPELKQSDVKDKQEPQWKYEEYSDWSRQLARNNTQEELQKQLAKLQGEQVKNTASHLRAVDKTTSMQSNSQHRAQSGNVVRGNYERRNAIENALEIHKYYPEKTKAANEKKVNKSVGAIYTFYGRRVSMSRKVA